MATPLTNTTAINHEANWTYITIREDAGNGQSCNTNDVPIDTIIPIGDFVASAPQPDSSCLSENAFDIRFHTIQDESITTFTDIDLIRSNPTSRVTQGVGGGIMCVVRQSGDLSLLNQIEYDTTTSNSFDNNERTVSQSCSLIVDSNNHGSYVVGRQVDGSNAVFPYMYWDSTDFQRTPTFDTLLTLGNHEITHGSVSVVGSTPPDYRSENNWNVFAGRVGWDNNTQTNISFAYVGEDQSIMIVNCFIPWDASNCNSPDTSNATLTIRKFVEFPSDSMLVRNVVFNEFCRGLLKDGEGGTLPDGCGVGKGFGIALQRTISGADRVNMYSSNSWDATFGSGGDDEMRGFGVFALEGIATYDSEDTSWTDDLGVTGWNFRDLCAYGTPSGSNGAMAWEAQDPSSSATKILAAINTPENDLNWTKPFIVTEGDDWGPDTSVHIRSQGNCVAYGAATGKLGVSFHVDNSTSSQTDIVVGVSQVTDFDTSPFFAAGFDSGAPVDEDEITSIQDGDSYFGIDLVNIADQWDTTLQSIQFITASGIIAIFVMSFGVALGFVGAVVGLALGIAVAFGMGLLPLWMILILVMFIAFLTGVMIFGGRTE